MFSILFTLTLVSCTHGAEKFNWGKCNGWPIHVSSFDTIEKADPSSHAFLRHSMDRIAVSKNKHRWAELSKSITGECTNGYTVPQDWTDISAGNMNYFISRFLADPQVEFKGRLWLLNGGPGGSGQDLWFSVPFIWEGLGGAYDLYVPDHRGTGNSSELLCPYKDCAAYIRKNYNKTSQTYSVDQAASDVILSLTLANTDDPRTAPNFIYGLSYGTYWGNRILELAPDIADAVVLDGICPSSLCRIATYDVNTDTVGEVFMGRCEDDSFCSNQFVDNNKKKITPYKAITELAAAIEGGNNKCASMLKLKKELFAQVNYYHLAVFSDRIVVPALVKRMMRCNTDDQKALKYLYHVATKKSAPSPATYPALGTHILLSEMFSGTNASATPPSAAALQNISNQAEFATYNPPQLRPMWDSWPKYTPEKRYYDKYAFSDRPLLLLNGDLDPQTPHYWAASAYSAYKYAGNSHVRFVTVPRSTHCTVFGAPVDVYMNKTCGLMILKNFLDSKGTVINSSCTSQVLAIDWEGTTKLGQSTAMHAFNTTDLWGK